MDITTKVLGWGAVGALVGCVALLTFQTLLVLPYLDRLESQSAEEKAAQVQSLFTSEAETFSLTTEDWASWDDAARFVQGLNPEFEASNLYPEAFESIRVDAMLYYRSDGSLAWGGQLSPDHQTLGPVIEQALFTRALKALGPKQAADGHQGYLSAANGLVLISVRQIRPPTHPGERAGTLVMIRKLDTSFWISLRKRTGVALYPTSPGADLSLTSGLSIRASADGTTTSLRIPMADLNGNFGLELGCTLPRTLSTNGVNVFKQVVWGSITILVLTTLANLFLVRVFLVRPIKDLWRLTRRVESTGDWSLRSSWHSRDEIGDLARGVNGLIESVEETTARLRELASTDALTGLDNRRSFDQSLELVWKLCRRDSHPFSVILADVDHFKQFNDTNGHLAGDACLKMVAQAFRDAAVRPGDIKARYGGEEFAVLLPHTDLAGARIVAERIRTAVGALGLVTVSLGCASELPRADASAIDVVHKADECLYAAKAAGRNRVIG